MKSIGITNKNLVTFNCSSKCLIFLTCRNKVLQTPLGLGENSEFYCSKFSVYNLTLSTKQNIAFSRMKVLKEEGQTKQPAASLLSKLVELNCSSDSMEVSLFADNCRRSEQKLFYLLKCCHCCQCCHGCLAVSKYSVYETVFFDHGHMQNENDSIHSVIEQNKREFQFIIPING